jgi:hypothetical protein
MSEIGTEPDIEPRLVNVAEVPEGDVSGDLRLMNSKPVSGRGVWKCNHILELMTVAQ